MSILIATTLTHLFSIIPLKNFYNTHTFHYINTIILSTLFSIIYHETKESNQLITAIDYILAAVWFFHDIRFAILMDRRDSFLLFYNNCIVCLLNYSIPYNKYYIILHSTWHILNAYKAYYNSRLIESYLVCNTRVQNT
jgi:hypothetical protein